MKTRLLIIIGIITIVTIGSLSLTYSQEILIGLGMLEIDPVPTSGLENNFTLTVSNQSFDIDPIDILVKIDGKTVIDEEFLVKQQHNYQDFEFNLEPGIHTLYAESIKGKYQLTEEFTIEKELWASLDFQYYEEDETLPELRLIISETKRFGL